MEKIGLKETFSGLLFDERDLWLRNRESSTAKALTSHQKRICTSLQKIGKTGDVSLILAVERIILATDLKLYANSSAMTGSLQNAISELETAEAFLPKVADPNRYRLVDDDCKWSKNRIGPLPRDEARQFFRSHAARLVNMDKSRLDDVEKVIIEIRKHNIRIAEKAYIQKQEQALGIVRKDKGSKQGLSR